MNIILNDNGKPCIKFRHNDKSKSNEDLLIGLFVKEAMQNGLKISSHDGYLNTTTGESFENYVIEPVNKEAVDNVIEIICKQNDDKDLRIKELEKQLEEFTFKNIEEIKFSAAINQLEACIKKIIESNKEPTITKQDIIEATPQRFKTGLADDEQPEPIEQDLKDRVKTEFTQKYSTTKIPNWPNYFFGLFPLLESNPKQYHDSVQSVFEEMNTIIKRDQEIKDKLKVAFAENKKALTEAIETNKRIETLIINL